MAKKESKDKKDKKQGGNAKKVILVVVAACLADIGIGVAAEHLPIEIAWPGAVMPFVVVCHIVTEIGSILENAIKMGAPCPRWLLKILKTARDTIDKEE